MRTVSINKYKIYADQIEAINIKSEKQVINTINAHSYIVAKSDPIFQRALVSSDILLPDGEGIVLMVKKLRKKRINKIAGADIHEHLLHLAQEKNLKCFYLGASERTLNLIKQKLELTFKNIAFEFYSPPFKSYFSMEDNQKMINKINNINPDILFVGMTAPKQEKWVFENRDKINSKIICSIGAVFDFVAETKKRAPKWIINLRMEWLYRSFTAWRLTKRYLYSTPLFLIDLYKIKYFSKRVD